MNDPFIPVWDVGTGERQAAIPDGLRKYADLAFSPDGRLLAWSAGNVIRFVNLSQAGR